MKKTLLLASSNEFLFKKLTTLLLFTALILGTGWSGYAQTITPVEKYHSIDAAASMTTQGWTSNLFVVSSTVGNARSGNRSYIYTNGTGVPASLPYIETETIANPSSFSFWIRRNSGTNVLGYKVEMLYLGTYYDLSNAGHLATLGIAAGDVTLPTLTNNTTYYNVTVNNIPVALTNVKFRVYDPRFYQVAPVLSGALNMDDFSWKSHNAALNNQLLPVLGAAANHTFAVPSNSTHYFYEVGGNYDAYSAGQDNKVIFTPVDNTYKVRATVEAFNTTDLNDYLQLYNDDSLTPANQVGANYFGTTTPTAFGTYTSTFANGSLSFRFVSNAGAIAGANVGYRIKIECIKCTVPTAFAGNGSFDTASLTWTGAATGYDVYYASTSTPVPNGSTVPQIVNNATTSATVTGLANSSTYYMWVRSNCGAGDYSGWAGPITITTICPPTTITYLENFNGLNLVLPTCTSADSSSWQTNITNGNLFTNAEGTNFFTRGVTLTANQPYRLSYDYSTNLNGTADMAVSYGTTNFAPSASNITTGVAYHSGFSTVQANITTFTPLTSGTYYIAFTLDYLSDPVGGAMNLDNVKLELETCLQPTAFAVTGGSITTSGATLTWSTPATGNPSNGYEYFVSTTNTAPGFNDISSGSVPFMTNTVVLNTLSPGTLYYVWVRGNCGGQKSVWVSVPVSFTTVASVNVVVEIDAVGPSSTGCNFTFLDSGGASFNYVDNETYTYTFIPGTAGSKLKAVFNTFSTENGFDGLMIYNGTSAIPANLISSGRAAAFLPTCPAGAFSGTASPGTILSTSADGALTFVFRSDGSVLRPGWSANITCVTPPVITDFNPKHNSCGSDPTPTVIISGTNLTGVTSVTFNGVAATSFAVNSATQITAIFPIAATTGKLVLTNATASASSVDNFEVQYPGPATTGGETCAGVSGGTIMTNVSCAGFGPATTTITSALNGATDPTAPRLEGMTNSPACAFVAGSIRNYVALDFQVTVNGTYSFTMPAGAGFDGMGYITQSGFTAGNCGSGTFIVGDDDSGVGTIPMFSANLVTGVTYTLYTTSFGGTGTLTTAYTWDITPPVGGGVMPFINSVTQWYNGIGQLVGTGSPFNPIGATNSGIASNTSVGVYTFYGACSTNPNCRTATTFEIKPGPTPTLPASFSSCANEINPLTVTGAGDTFTWTSTVANTLYTDAAATILYVPMTNATTVYVKSPSTVTVTVLGTLTLNSCQRSASVVIATPTTTWNGAVWSAGAPNVNTAAVFNGNYVAGGNVSACSVTINSGAVSFGVGQTLTVINDVKLLGGSLTMGNESSLLQVNNTINTGNVTYVRASAPVVRYDYSYWSTPVTPQTLSAASPATSWDGFYSYSGTAWQWAPSATQMSIGKGYIIRVPLTYSTTMPSSQIVNFWGVPNNGTYTTPVVGGSDQLNLLGNPYPSALSADAFMSYNSTILDGTIYFWTHNTPISGGQYDFDDYAIYNYMGGTGTRPALNPGLNMEVPNGKIASGQGFFIKGLANGNATFTNLMRLAGNNDQFFRMNGNNTVRNNNNVIEKHRYWIDIFNATGVYKQNLLGYITGGTMDIDRGMDSEVVTLTSPVTLYTKVGDMKLAIQGRGLPFDVNDQIPLAFNSTTATTYTIRLSQFDGLFENQAIYLEDTLLNVIHNLKGGDYNFATAAGTFENRFILRYTDATLGVDNPVFDENTVVVYRNGDGLFVNSGAVNMTQVTIFDIRGRQLAEQKNINDTEIVFTTLPETQQVVLVKIKAENGAEITKKVVF